MAQKEVNTLWSIYGARKSESGERFNISIVQGSKEEGTLQFATISLRKEGGKVACKEDEEFVYLKIKKLPKKEKVSF